MREKKKAEETTKQLENSYYQIQVCIIGLKIIFLPVKAQAYSSGCSARVIRDNLKIFMLPSELVEILAQVHFLAEKNLLMLPDESRAWHSPPILLPT